MRSEICVATRSKPPNAANARPPSHSGLVPAINITTNVVAAIKAVVPRSTSPSTSTASTLIIASGIMNSDNTLPSGFSRRANQAARKKIVAIFASSDG